MKSLYRLLPYYRPYRLALTWGLILVIVGSATLSVIPWVVRMAIDAVQAGDDLRRIWQLAAAMIGVGLAGGAMRYGMREMLNGLSRRIEFDLRNDLFTHLTRLDAAYFGRMRTGEVMARLTNDLSAVRMAAGPAIMYLVSTVAGGLFALGFMLRIDRRLTLLALLPMSLVPVLMARLGRVIHDRFEDVQAHFGLLTTLAQENIAGVRVVRAYRQEYAEESRFGRLNDEYLTKNMRLVRLYGALNPAFALLAGIAAAVVLGVGGALALHGSITVGAFVAFGLYLAALTWPMVALGWVVNLFERGAASMGRLNELLDAVPTVTSPADSRTRPFSLPPFDGGGRRLEFRDVGFHYPTREGETPRWVLRGISFVVPAGTTVGLVGATGSGKSALVDLIPRLYDPQEGEILLDGVPIRDLPLHELRGELGYVPQETLLFSDTIASNLAYGVAKDPAAAREAAAVAQLDETIAAFPGGYETMLGERGINLSGGQQQRAALARALARKPSVVLLDDSLSAVDAHTEAAILGALRGALVARTALVVTHRASAVRDAQQIVVLEEGQIVERGVHADLLARGGRYWSLVRRQELEESIEDGENLKGTGDRVAAEPSLA
ncbi:MAG: ABC transporter ATP-binding protein [Gemmatimonadaceae bacterium]